MDLALQPQVFDADQVNDADNMLKEGSNIEGDSEARLNVVETTENPQSQIMKNIDGNSCRLERMSREMRRK